MSIMRSFTIRRKQPELEPAMPNLLGRAASQRGGRPVARAQISSPVALVSTTNMLSFNAPDIAGTEPVEHRDTSSSEESDSSSSIKSKETDPTDLSSPEASPISAEPNHLSQYFKAAAEDAARQPRSQSASRPSLEASPSLPRRALSHSKRAHEALSRKRSLQRSRSASAQGRGLTRMRSSADIFNPDAMIEAKPFGLELTKLDENEELGSKLSEAETDALYLKNRNLARLDASAYLGEIDGLVAILLDDQSPSVPDFSGWF